MVNQLKELGFESAAKNVEEKKDLVRKMALAYEFYDHITKENVDEFNKLLKNKTRREDKEAYYFDKLSFTEIKEYTEVPPQDVLNKLKEAQDRKCFDYYEIAKIESVVERKDPILFGRIKDCGDYFFIAQWDDDITLEIIKDTIKK